MKTTIKILIAVCIVGFTFIALALKPEPAPQKNKVLKDGNSFAVVELFTSEGCSSCPPADRLLGNILEKARNNNKNIYALAFHVDYWNNLGWKDIYSSAKYSQRQRSYARALHSSVYTPQMIVNGEDQFVGSNSGHARSSINDHLHKSPAATVSLGNIERPSKDKLLVNYKITGNYGDDVLNVAVVERGIVRDIKRGENTGLTMHHENVVRSFNTISLKQADGKTSLRLPANIDSDHASVIAYVQNPSSKEIIGAQRKDL